MEQANSININDLTRQHVTKVLDKFVDTIRYYILVKLQ